MHQTEGGRQIKTVRCPYIPQHIMPEGSLLNHLSKCSASNKHLFAKCKYNPLHVYPKTQIQNHYKKCKDREKFQKQNIQSSESWDSDSETKKSISQKPLENQSKVEIQSENSQIKNQSTIQNQRHNSSDSGEWNQIISNQDEEKQTKTKLSNLSIQSNQKTNIFQKKPYFQSGSHLKQQSGQSSFNNSVVELRKENSQKLKYQQTGEKITKGVIKKDLKICGLSSDSFSFHSSNKDDKNQSDAQNKGYDTLNSFSEGQQKRDNLKEKEQMRDNAKNKKMQRSTISNKKQLRKNKNNKKQQKVSKTNSQDFEVEDF